MSIQNKPTSKLYDRFRSSDDQINFLMSDKGEMQLDREIIKMMKQMNVDEIVEFANQFFKFKENQCQSLHTLVTKELSMRKDESEQCQKFTNHNKVQQFLFQQATTNIGNAQRNKQTLVSNLDNFSNILAEMNNIHQALEQDFISESKSNKFQQGFITSKDEDIIDFEQYKNLYEDYVPKVSPDEDYLTQKQSNQQNQVQPKMEMQFMQFDKLPAHMLLTPEQIKEMDQKSVIIKNSENIDKKIQIIIQKDQQKSEIKKEQIKQQQSVLPNQPQEQKTEPQQIQQNPQQVHEQVPTTVQENQEYDFQEIERISLPDNKYKITYNNGDQYQGELQNEMKNGWGDYHYNTGERYQGFFVDDQIQGYGQYFFLSGASYEGDWSSGMKHGVGILKFSNGDVYQGQFVKDQFHGKGTYNYANGDVFTGLWKEGQKHGKGKLETFDGSLQMGNWVFDKFQI